VDKPAIEEKSQWRHKRRHSRKVHVTKVWEVSDPGGKDTWGVAFDIHDPERDQMPWRDGSVLGAAQFLEDYEPDLPAVVVIQDEATALVAELIAKVEAKAAPELVALRARIENVLHYLDGVTAPNMHTMSHIRRMLTTDDGSVKH
jgi:hypothetical protein